MTLSLDRMRADIAAALDIAPDEVATVLWPP